MKDDYPLFWGVTRHFDTACLENPVQEVTRLFESFLPISSSILKDKTVAVCVGSRGIASLPVLVRTSIKCLKARGADVFIVPSMGSHGGGTAEGQKQLLEGLGITEEAMGVHIHPDMATTDICRLPNGPTVRFATEAFKADFVFPICRVKEHTILTGDVQSGICKMLVIGCGKHKGAKEYHKFDIAKTLVPSAEIIIDRISLLGALAVAENSYDKLYTMRLVGPKQFIETDKELLRIAKNTLPRLPFTELDALIINEIGKNISGAGADVNVIGKWRREGGPRIPDFRIMAVLGITPASHGNATGIGCMDIMPERLLHIIDYDAMRINVLTSGTFRSARLPLYVKDDRTVLDAILNSVPNSRAITMTRILNTLDLQRFWITEKLSSKITSDMHCTIDNNPQKCTFNKHGILLDFI
ncbi:DUF362 domain-containing protein [uncultured Desulfovibrio sp.]|uniref:DUF362 domain-containing protein n=1 Tax=uncultured Desulfovibrio sp. TaxID=167968 RepID=UPI00262C857A|nr:DUF362 domain-containing protein [uncultured Desulfovibrio sp.]